MRLRNITPAALQLWIYQIHYTDMIYMILVTGDWILISLSFVPLLFDQFWVYTRRCPLRKSTRHLAWRLLGNSLPLDFPKSRIDLINYSTVIDCFTFRTKAVFELWIKIRHFCFGTTYFYLWRTAEYQSSWVVLKSTTLWNGSSY